MPSPAQYDPTVFQPWVIRERVDLFYEPEEPDPAGLCSPTGQFYGGWRPPRRDRWREWHWSPESGVSMP